MGCVFFWFAMLFVPIILVVLCLFFGILFGAFVAALVSTIALYLLTKKGFFERYKNSEIAWQRYGAVVLRVLLIIVMVIGWLLTILFGGFLGYKISGV